MNTHTPDVRQRWDAQGGIYAGTVHPRDGMPAYRLLISLSEEARVQPAPYCSPEAVLLPGSHWDGRSNMASLLTVDPANAIATQIRAKRMGGHDDWYWPSKLECAVLYANVGDLVYSWMRDQRVPQWGTWICQRAREASSAFVHDWRFGGQTQMARSKELTALVVRRIATAPPL
jgi:hypothetical protein